MLRCLAAGPQQGPATKLQLDCLPLHTITATQARARVRDECTVCRQTIPLLGCLPTRHKVVGGTRLDQGLRTIHEWDLIQPSDTHNLFPGCAAAKPASITPSTVPPATPAGSAHSGVAAWHVLLPVHALCTPAPLPTSSVPTPACMPSTLCVTAACAAA
jgi:hypothetical protein